MKDNFNITISRTILDYMMEKKRELVNVCRILKRCTNINVRRILRIKKKQLIAILNDADASIKTALISQLGISYKKIKLYPELIEIKRKEQYLKHFIL